MSDFIYKDNGAKETLVLIPGWATDYRVFETIEVLFNYVFVKQASLENLHTDLRDFLKARAIDKISLLGWSLGGFLAGEFALLYPEIIDKLILVSIRKSYEASEIEKVKLYLKENKRAYLYSFYISCFHNKENLSWFKESLLKDYCRKFELDYLLVTLDYLAKSRIDTLKLKTIENIRIVHGECDNIAPIEEAIDIVKSIPHAKFIKIEGAGHAPFLNKEFFKILW